MSSKLTWIIHIAVQVLTNKDIFCQVHGMHYQSSHLSKIVLVNNTSKCIKVKL